MKMDNLQMKIVAILLLLTTSLYSASQTEITPKERTIKKSSWKLDDKTIQMIIDNRTEAIKNNDVSGLIRDMNDKFYLTLFDKYNPEGKKIHFKQYVKSKQKFFDKIKRIKNYTYEVIDHSIDHIEDRDYAYVRNTVLEKFYKKGKIKSTVLSEKKYMIYIENDETLISTMEIHKYKLSNEKDAVSLYLAKKYKANHKQKEENKIYETLCNDSNDKGCLQLAYIYRYGEGVKQDLIKASQLMEKSCSFGGKIACGQIQSTLYHNDIEALEKLLKTNKSKDAIKKLNNYCDKKVSSACSALAYLYSNDNKLANTKQDIVKSLKYFKKGCKDAKNQFSCENYNKWNDAKFLLNKVANSKTTHKHRVEQLQGLIDLGYDINTKLNDDGTILLKAIANKDLIMTKLLLENGAKTSIVVRNKTILEWAKMFFKMGKIDKEIVELMETY